MTEENIDQNWMGNEEDEIYRENIIDHYKSPHNFGKLETYTYQHREVNPVCGDVIEVFLQVDNNKLTDIKFAGKGCAISIATMSMLTDTLKNKDIDEIKKMTEEQITNLLGIKLGIVRMKCGVLGLKAITKTLNGATT